MSPWNDARAAAARAAHGSLTAALLAALLAGCVAGPDFKPPADTTLTAYTSAPPPHLADAASAGADGDALAWWQPLHSERLDATIRLALEQNRDLAAARATLGQMQELAAASEGARFPSLDLEASSGREKYGAAFLGPEKLPPFSFYSVGFGVSYLFDFAGGVRRSVEQQYALAVRQQHEVEAAALSLSGNVALQALAVASARAQIESLQAVLADDEKNLKLVQDAFAAGSATRVDVLNAQSQLANDQ